MNSKDKGFMVILRVLSILIVLIGLSIINYDCRFFDHLVAGIVFIIIGSGLYATTYLSNE